MSRVDFYLLPTSNPQQRRVLACKLAEKAWRQGLKVYLHTGSEVETDTLDKLLWTFRIGSFVPHARADGSLKDIEDVEVLIGNQIPPADFQELLINLSSELLPQFQQFQRIAEILDEDVGVKAQGRKRYSVYKQQGAELETHKLSL